MADVDKAALTLRKELMCLNCWHRFLPEDVLWISEHRDFLGGDPILKNDAPMRFVPARFTLQGDAIDPRGQVCGDIACPNCRLHLPRALLEHEPLLISIIGAQMCGKSYYLGALTWSLRRTLPQIFKLEFSDTNPATNHVLHKYEEKLFLSDAPNERVMLGDLIPKTQLGGDNYNRAVVSQQEVLYPKPFSFVLKPLDGHRHFESSDRVARVCCLYDNGGERFLPGVDPATVAGTKHLAMSNLLLFLYDPTQDPRARELLTSDNTHQVPPPTPKAGRQETIVQEVGIRIRRQLNLHRTAKISQPIIVIVTKADLWGDVIKDCWNEEPFVFIEKSGGHALDSSGIDQASQATREILEKYVPEFVSSVESLSDSVSYIPVSAIGNRPVWDSSGAPSIRSEQLQPAWVSVPFIHGLALTVPGAIARCKRS